MNNNYKKIFISIILVIFISLPFNLITVQAAPLQQVTTTDLINLINQLRTANGLPALEVDYILMSTAQQTADTMALYGMRTHIGDVSGRIQAAGYGGGAKVWATENFAIGPFTIDQIQVAWNDPDHMLPATNTSYIHIGAGITKYNDRTWYVVQAAYTSGSSAVQYTSNPSQILITSTPPVSQIIIPVQTVTPDENGAVIHEVMSGQALWSIAIAYDTKINDLIRLNNLDPETPTIYLGQKLLIFEAVRTPVSTENTPTVDPSQTTPTVTPTLRPTRTMTITANPIENLINQTPTVMPEDNPENQGSFFNRLFQNKVIGVILVSVLALGILLIVTGSFGKDPGPVEKQKEVDE